MANEPEIQPIQTRNRSRIESVGSSKSSPLTKQANTIKQNKKVKPVICCYECKLDYDINELNISQTTYLLLMNMEENGSRWHCQKCLTEPTSTISKSKQPNNVEKQIEQLCVQMLSIKDEMKEITESQKKFQDLAKSLEDSTKSIEQSVSNTSWADIASSGNSNNQATIADSFATKVANKQKSITLDREQRENNIIIYNVPKSDKEEDINFFNNMCTDGLKFEKTFTVSLERIRSNMDNYEKPLKVCFEHNFDKRKFLSSLYQLDQNKKYEDIIVKHDMNYEDRMESKRLLKEAYTMNLNEKPKKFRYKVRGPPWSMKIVKIFSKNEVTQP